MYYRLFNQNHFIKKLKLDFIIQYLKNMKRLINLAVILLVLSQILSSCGKEELASPVELNSSQKATLTGLVYAQLNLLNDTMVTKYEFAPSGTKIIVKIDARQLAVNPPEDVEFTDLLYTTEVKADGSFSIELPAISKGLEATVIFNDFTYNQVPAYRTEFGYYRAGDPVRKIYKADEFSITLVAGQTIIQDVYYQVQ